MKGDWGYDRCQECGHHHIPRPPETNTDMGHHAGPGGCIPSLSTDARFVPTAKQERTHMSIFNDWMAAQRSLAGLNNRWDRTLDEVRLSFADKELLATELAKATTAMRKCIDLLRESGATEGYRNMGSPTLAERKAKHLAERPPSAAPAEKPMDTGHPWRNA